MPSNEESIRRLLFLYAEFLDAANYPALGALLGDATLYVSGVDSAVSGADDIRDFFDGMNHLDDSGSPGTHFMTTNSIIDIVGFEATCRSYMLCLQGGPSGITPIAAGRYHDRFRYTDEKGWRFSERRILLDMSGDLSGHVRFDPSKDNIKVTDVLKSRRERGSDQ
jgi:SnoaL-like domain